MNAKKDDKLLTPKKLVVLGIYESTYDLYVELCDMTDNFIKEHGISLSLKVDPLLYKKKINEYFSRHYMFFSDRKFFINNPILNRFYILTTINDIKRPLTIIFKNIGFSCFLTQLEEIIKAILINQNKNLGLNGKFNHEILEELYSTFNHAIQLGTAGKLYGESIEYELTADSNPIFVYKHLFNLKCNRQKHNVIPQTLIIKELNSITTCNLPVNYCVDCNKYFIGKTSLSILQKEHGLILVKFKPCELEDEGDRHFTKYKAESDLHACGYNVIDGKIAANTRKALLVYFLEKSVMTVFEIRRDIEKAILIFENRNNYINAVKAWRDDLSFLDNYVTEKPICKGIIKN